MPVVTVDPNEYERFELKSAPPDGYIMVRPLPYGMRLTMRDKAFKQRMVQQIPKKGKRVEQQDEIPVELLSDNVWATNFELGYCIGDHNLQTRDEQLIDFSKPFALQLLNPKVGAEIEKIMLDVNADEEDESIEDFTKRLSGSSDDQNMYNEDSGTEILPPGKKHS
jgi:hypothetical protein